MEIIYNNHENHFRTLCAHSSPLGKSIFLFVTFIHICQIATHTASQPHCDESIFLSVSFQHFQRELRWVNSEAIQLAYLVYTAIDSSPGTPLHKVPALPHRSHTVHRRCAVCDFSYVFHGICSVSEKLFIAHCTWLNTIRHALRCSI